MYFQIRKPVRFVDLERVTCIFAVLFILLSISSACADGVTQKILFEQVFQMKTPLSIAVTGEPGNGSVDLPAVPEQKGNVLCLRFRAFLVTGQPAGWNPFLKISVNGKLLQGRMPDGSSRLLNRGVDAVSKSGPISWWQNNESLLTFFGPESGELDSRMLSSRDEGYWYVLNISDLANYLKIGVDNRVESNSPNQITFTNAYTLRDTGETVSCREMRIEDLSVGYVPRETVEKLQLVDIKPIPDFSGKTFHRKGYSLTVTPSGGMQVKVGENRYAFTSAYSHPGDSIGYHQFTWESLPDSGWKTEMMAGRKRNILVVKGESKRYTVTRTLTLYDGKIGVSDKIDNKTSEPLGLSIRNNIFTPTQLKPEQVYLCGIPDVKWVEWCSMNPSILVKQSASSVGLICEDTLLRTQLAVSSKESSAQFGTEHFGLEAGKSYTIEWTIYPSQTSDYFAFINRVRKEWGVNSTVRGPFVFSDIVPVRGRKTELYDMHPFYGFADGGHLTTEEYKKIVKAQVKDLLAKQSDAIPIGMIESNLVTVDRNKISVGNAITKERIYGTELTVEQTSALAKSPLYGRWFDSIPKTADGRAIIDTSYAYKPNLINMLVYPVIGNHQFEYMMWQIDMMMDECGCKGICMDDFDIGYTVNTPGRSDYSKWDGHTIDLDTRGNIARKYTDASLVGTSARTALIKHVIDKGGVVITNGHPYSKELAGLPGLSYVETEWACSDPKQLLESGKPEVLGEMTASHLCSPIGLGICPTALFKDNPYAVEHFTEIIQKWVITGFKNGMLYYYYTSRIPETGPGSGEYGVINYMFPFTPVELHDGWLIGKERILTAVSGMYTWNRSEKPVCLVFDLKGRRVTPNVKMLQNGNTWDVDLKLSDWKETAVIMSEDDL